MQPGLLTFCFCSYEERKRSLETVASRHKDSTTYEEFSARIYSPIPLPNSSTSLAHGSGHVGAPLASALIDHHHRNSTKSKWCATVITAACIFHHNLCFYELRLASTSRSNGFCSWNLTANVSNDNYCARSSVPANAPQAHASVQERTEEQQTQHTTRQSYAAWSEIQVEPVWILLKKNQNWIIRYKHM